MMRRGLRQATPTPNGPVGEEPFLDFTACYVVRARDILPKQGTRKPWKVHQNYAKDLFALKIGSVDDEMMFSNPVKRRVKEAA